MSKDDAMAERDGFYALASYAPGKMAKLSVGIEDEGQTLEYTLGEFRAIRDLLDDLLETWEEHGQP